MASPRGLVERFYAEVINGKHFDVLDEICSPDFVEHGTPAPPPGVEGFKGMLGSIVGGFPDVRLRVEDWVVEDDRVVARVTVRGTHQGPFLGADGTGRRVTWTALHLWRVSGDRLVERWSEADVGAIRDQIGA